MKKLLASSLLGALILLGAAPVQAAYPEKPINVVVAFAPGGTGDVTVRMLAKPLEKILGQPLVIVNKGGGAGLPGFEYVMKAKPDGYTVSAPGVGSCTSSAIFLKNKVFNFDDMELAGQYMTLDRIVLSKKDKPWKNWDEFVAYVKANPGKVSMGSGASQEATEVLRAYAIREGLDINFAGKKLEIHLTGNDPGGTAGKKSVKKIIIEHTAGCSASAAVDDPQLSHGFGNDIFPFQRPETGFEKHLHEFPVADHPAALRRRRKKAVAGIDFGIICQNSTAQAGEFRIRQLTDFQPHRDQ